MRIIYIFLSIALAFSACIRIEPGRAYTAIDGPYIDSIGHRAAIARIDNVDDQSTGTLIHQALKVQDNEADAPQPDFFQSLEESYQRYLKLFRRAGRDKNSVTMRDYDLQETFRAKIFDPQPFMNALLHTMGLAEISTLDYTVTKDNADTLVVQVTWARPTAQLSGKGFGITEGTLALCVTKHAVSPAGPLPGAQKK